MCIKKHPSEENELRFKEDDNIKIIKEEDLGKNNLTVNEILNASDILIMDYSSLGIDFLILNKSVIYINKDVKEYEQNRGIIFSNIDYWIPGYKTRTVEGLIDNIKEATKKGIYSDQVKIKKCGLET